MNANTPEKIGKIFMIICCCAAAGLSLIVGLFLFRAVIWRCWTK